MNIEERMQDLEKQVNEITETAARLRETFEREQKQVASRVPKIRQSYWYVTAQGAIAKVPCWENDHADNLLLTFGNVYLTEAEAIKARDQKLAEVRVITRLRELDGGFVADWGDRSQRNYGAYFDHDLGKLKCSAIGRCQYFLPHWVSTLSTWNQVIQEIPEDVKLMLGVEV